MAKKTFIKGAAVLGAAGLLVQVMGAVMRIPLANIIGEEGMGYFQTAYPIYVFLLVFSTNGAPAAISKMTSERIAVGEYAEAHRVFKLAFTLMFAFGLVAFLAVFFFAEPLVKIFNNPGAYYAMAAISPALLFVPVMSVFRGYFQGMQEMLPTAASQLIEQAVRVSVSLVLAVALVPKGIKIAAAGGSLGTSAGPVAGVLALMVIYWIRRGGVRSRIIKDQNPERVKAGELLKTLAALAIPTTIGVSILPIMNIVDVLISMGRMQAAGFSEQDANSLYGLMSGFAAPIINIPMALALSVAISLVPAVAAAKSTEDRGFLDMNIKMGLRTAMLIGVPCSFGLMLLARPIMTLIYPMKAESAAGAAVCLAILGGGVIFLSVAQTMAGILQGLGKASLPVISLLAGVAVKTVSTWFLAAVPSLNIDGAALGSTLGYLVIALLNLYYVKKLTNINFDIKLSVLKPLACGAMMGVAVTAVYYALAGLLGGSLSCLLAICAGAAVYVAAVFKIGAIQADELSLISAGGRLAAVFKRIKSWNGK